MAKQPPIDFERLWQRVTKAFALPAASVHGPDHWKQVERNGLFIAQRTAARLDVVRLFALFHDSKRINEFDDPEHGSRAAEFARTLRGKLFAIDDQGFQLLHDACAGHTTLERSEDPTIGTCLDADRLDLWRVGITPNPQFMSTNFARWLAQRSDLNFLFLDEEGKSRPTPGS